jgi:hypothetical protein
MKSKSVLGAVTAAALFASSAFAADTATTASTPLPAGKAAGTKEAAFIGPMAPIVVGVLIAAFVAVAASGGFNDDKATTGTGG